MSTEISREYLESKAEAFTRKAAELREQADRFEQMAADFRERASAPSRA